jgi:hypothetical protein
MIETTRPPLASTRQIARLKRLFRPRAHGVAANCDGQ